MLRACTICGAPSTSSRCPQHAIHRLRGGARVALHQRILNRDLRRCQLRLPGCTLIATCVDHVLPLAAGGTDHPSNLRASCDPCNRQKGAN